MKKYKYFLIENESRKVVIDSINHFIKTHPKIEIERKLFQRKLQNPFITQGFVYFYE